uniref:NADH-ubiquinone oxidoreductase chain 4L n=1 Tax=Ophiophthalmus serratus TaxID=2993811 RepID=A0A9E8ICU4_9ECHI|nr:NADH dehydrogenase subunit 4L [Ophiophthalmus serratus]UZG65880.1 NADH dehydrogenase subunit 4L [Ophiophthalmus serratus]
MNLIYISFFILIPFNILSIIYNKNFILSILLALESLLLIILSINFIISYFFINDFISQNFSLFIIALAAIEASIGLSILTLISRNFNECNINQLNLLNN